MSRGGEGVVCARARTCVCVCVCVCVAMGAGGGGGEAQTCSILVYLVQANRNVRLQGSAAPKRWKLKSDALTRPTPCSLTDQEAWAVNLVNKLCIR